MAGTRYRFDTFEIDVPKRRLLRDGELVPLNPKAFDLLCVLVEHNGALLTKDDLLRLVWDGQFVEEANLTVNMSAIRRALGDTAKSSTYITTVSGRGYYFTADVERIDGTSVPAVRTQTVSRIVLAEETVEEDDEAPAALPAALSSRRTLWIAAAAVALIVFGIVGAFYWFRESTAQPYARIEVRRLTSTGRLTGGALSPDGKLFAYSEQEKDGRIGISVEHVDGGQRIELRPAVLQSITNMTFTPDGSKLYYSVAGSETERNGLYRIPAFGGAPEFLREGVNRVTFAPDGSKYAFVSHDLVSDTSIVKIADLDAGSDTTVAERSSQLPFVSSSVDWSRDGRYIAVSAVSDESTREQEIFVVDRTSGEVRQLTTSRWNGIRALTWTEADRGLMATGGDQDVGWEAQLWYIPVGTGEPTRIISDLNTYGIVLSAARTGQSLLAIQSQSYSNIWVAPSTDLGAAKQITFDMLGRQNGWDGLDWTPEGKIIYTSYADRSETIWSIDLETNSTKQLIPNGRRNIHLSVSRDGRFIVFFSNRSGANEIWIANADGSNMRQLTTGGFNSTPHISPDGTKVIYQSVLDGRSALWQIGSDGQTPQKLIDQSVAWAQFSNDGRFIAGTINDGGRTKLGVFSAVGGEPIKKFDLPTQANVRLGIHWTPDDRAVTYRDWGYGIWRQDVETGALARLDGLPEEKVYAYAWSKDGQRFAYARGMEIRDTVLITEKK